MNVKTLLDSKTPFVCFYWDPTEKELTFDCISEYNESDGNDYINFSERRVDIENTKIDPFVLFYDEKISRDGYLVNICHYDSVSDLMDNEYIMHISNENMLFTPINLNTLSAKTYIAFKTTEIIK
jgi:hypothetical protein